MFCFDPTRLCYTKFFSAYESLFNTLSQNKIFECTSDATNIVKTTLKSICMKSYYSFKPKLHDRNLKNISTLKKLSTDRNIVITKPDKGSGIVILHKKDYILMR